MQGRFDRLSFEQATDAERRELCEGLAAAVTDEVRRATDFFACVYALVGELRAAGHDLWAFDSDGESFEIWCPDYATPAGPGIIVTFRADGPCEVAWSSGFARRRDPPRANFEPQMEITFGIEAEPALEALRQDVIEHRRAARVHVEFRRSDSRGASAHSVATAFAKTLTMRPPEVWTELDADGALEAATRVLHEDLAYNMPLMTIALAESLARRFLACCGEGAVFVTNGSLAEPRDCARGWSPLTDATFDAGIVGISSRRVGLLVVEDED